MKALIISGGGSRAAWASGVVKYLTQSGKKYDIITGISSGALCAGFLGQYENDIYGAEALVEFWKNINQKDIYKHWFPFGYLHALWKKSAYNSKPLWKMVEKEIKTQSLQLSGKKIAVGAVCLNNGEYKLFKENDDNFVKGMLASSAFPGAFCPVEIDGKLWVDGGVRHLTPIGSAIKMGATEMDIIITSKAKSKKGNNNDSTSTIPLVLRSLNVMRQEISEGDIETLRLYNELVKAGKCTDKKYIEYNLFRPKNHLVGNILEFDKSEINKNIILGYDDAKRILGG